MRNAASAATAEQPALLKVEISGPVLSVGLNRPAKRNALNDGIILAIADCFSDIPDDIRAVVIHGIGDHFSSGLDLSELTEQDATEGLQHSQMWHRVFDRVQYCRVPVIAALKGAVIGGGLLAEAGAGQKEVGHFKPAGWLRCPQIEALSRSHGLVGHPQ
jgi:enoyl-CoA hydratase/carnithine racemase